jgi:hypothetical protein
MKQKNKVYSNPNQALSRPISRRFKLFWRKESPASVGSKEVKDDGNPLTSGSTHEHT